MDEIVKADLFRYAGKTDFKTFIWHIVKIPGFRFIYILRKLKKYKRYSLPWFFYAFFYRRYSHRYHFQIYTATTIGKGFYIGHWGPIVISPVSVIGDNCTLSHNITIGQTNRGKNKGAPVLGNKVFIGAGAVLVGKITIGDEVLIAPNSYVNMDVPSRSIVIGNPAKIIAKDDAVEGYVNNVV